jgi:hypothetical protein
MIGQARYPTAVGVVCDAAAVDRGGQGVGQWHA